MVTSSIILDSASNRITARLAGKSLTSLFRQPPGGSIPPGNYTLSPPMHNSVYGTFAILSLARPAAAAMRPDWINKDWVSRGSMTQDWVTRGQAGADWVQNPLLLANQPGVFVLVDKPLAGRNAIVITGSFAELMGALQHAGGATVTVA